MDFSIKYFYMSPETCLFGLLDHKNICLDTNFAFISALVPKIWAFKNFEWRPFWKVHKKYISHGRIAWGFFPAVSGAKWTTKTLQSVCLQFCPGRSVNWLDYLELLNLKSLFHLNCLKFVYNFRNGFLPKYFLSFKYTPRSSIHDHDTRSADLIDVERTRTVMVGNCIRNHLATVLNTTSRSILDKIEGFIFYTKRSYLNQLQPECQLRECYVCGR